MKIPWDLIFQGIFILIIMDLLYNYDNLVKECDNIDSRTPEEIKLLLTTAKSTLVEYKSLQNTIKTDANSLYGSFGNKYFILRDYDIATDITMTAKHYACLADRGINQFFTQWSNEENLRKIKKLYPDVTELRNFTEYTADTPNDLCVYGDTDSRFIDIEMLYSLLIVNGKRMELPKDRYEIINFSLFMDKNFLSKVIAEVLEEDINFRNANPGHLKMGHEVTTLKCIFQKKKKYVCSLIWEDGKTMTKHKFKTRGVELRRGESSNKCKDVINKLIDKYLYNVRNEKEIRQDLQKVLNHISKIKDIEYIYGVTSVNGLSEIKKDKDGVWTSDKKHLQMQIARNWLNIIDENKLHGLYKPMFEGQKVKYYKTKEGSKYAVVGIPDDVDFTKELMQYLPEPDWRLNAIDRIIKPVLRYMYDNDKLTVDNCMNLLHVSNTIEL